MPANLTPQYLAAEAKFKAAKTIEEKLAALEEMHSTIPKHKGTEKMVADIKRRIAKLKEEGEKKSSRKSFSLVVEKQGAAQVALAGLPNSGKSSILAALTNARPQIADYPFTTTMPLPGMMKWENVTVQLVDLPPFSPEADDSTIAGLVRNADGVILVVDLLADNVLEQVSFLEGVLEKVRLRLTGDLEGEQYLEDGTKINPALIIATKADLDEDGEILGMLREIVAGRFRIIPFSAVTGLGVDEARVEIWKMLKLNRAYCKSPGKEPDKSTPVILKKGATLLDFAVKIHKDFATSLSYARVWGRTVFDGQRVQKDYRIEDGDVIELHV